MKSDTTVVRVTLRLPSELHAYLQSYATGQESLNGEIVRRLWDSCPDETLAAYGKARSPWLAERDLPQERKPAPRAAVAPADLGDSGVTAATPRQAPAARSASTGYIQDLAPNPEVRAAADRAFASLPSGRPAYVPPTYK